MRLLPSDANGYALDAEKSEAYRGLAQMTADQNSEFLPSNPRLSA
jgi:hypothetical protein